MTVIKKRYVLPTIAISVLILGFALWWTASNSQSSLVSAREIALEAKEHRDSLLSSLTEGSVLYRKISHNNLATGEGHPAMTIQEVWTLIGEDISRKAEKSKTYDTNGNLVYTSETDGTVTVFSDLLDNLTLELPAGSGAGLGAQLTDMWSLPQRLETDGYSARGQGMLNGRTSLIYDTTVDLPEDETGPAETVKTVIELVSDDPLLHRFSSYDGTGTLRREVTLLEYQVLDQSAFPQ